MTALVLAAAKTIEGNPLSERLPVNTVPGTVFVICVISAMILFLVWVWYKNFGPGAPPEETVE